MTMMQAQVPPTVSCDFERRLSPSRRAGRSILATALAALLGCFAVMAAAPVTITHARIRLLPGDLPLAGYFDLTNGTDRPLVLTGASSPAFQMVHMHHSMESGGMSTMAPAERIEVKPGATVQFAPGGYHLMLMHRLKPLQVGQEVPLRLEFASGDSVQAMFVVEGAQGK
jgi:periplasmic copper chaperone A